MTARYAPWRPHVGIAPERRAYGGGLLDGGVRGLSVPRRPTTMDDLIRARDHGVPPLPLHKRLTRTGAPRRLDADEQLRRLAVARRRSQVLVLPADVAEALASRVANWRSPS